jgi:hypothetical protein
LWHERSGMVIEPDMLKTRKPCVSFLDLANRRAAVLATGQLNEIYKWETACSWRYPRWRSTAIDFIRGPSVKSLVSSPVVAKVKIGL